MAGRSLRTRLVVTVVTLLAVVCVALSTVTTLVLYHFLVRKIDEQLVPLPPNRIERRLPLSGELVDRELVVPFGLPSGSLIARVTDGRVADAVIRTASADTEAAEARTSGQQSVPPDRLTVLTTLSTDGRPRSRDLGELGDYRVAARTMPDGSVAVIGIPLSEVRETVWWMVAAQAGLVGTGLLIAGTTGALILRAELRPLRRVAATAGRVAELPLDRGEVALSVRVPDADTDLRTEVGQVGNALNRMLGHVAAALAARHASETRVRQFVADASHELRTPLAAIRGYAELARRGRYEVPPDVAHALRRVESESTRMTRLVDDLLLLARLDSGRPLAVEPVDLSALVVDAVSDAHVAGPDHRWNLDLPDVEITVPGDAARLHQVLANLLANARTHTPAGTVVTTTLARTDDTVVLTVTDNGPGIPKSLQGEVFERFARGDTSRSRAAGSTGLGLAIVAAVVEAHHGTVAVRSVPGHTGFTVRLPAFTVGA
ncbi:HAMP domain-containing sensor histidine kinase [Micromonospora sp. CPCC 206060]|uniref:sensor histidine kinase n=1 Tax=Micromonospora sp. CPCC 206060 TaxID=3122406 RepID=UPI002FF1FB1C